MERAPTYTIEWKQRIADVDGEAWDALAVPLDTPIFEWEWLRQMEESGSICPDTGWLPFHLTVWKREPPAAKRLVAAAPLYIKGHSSGEFVYDFVWADVAAQLGVEYYPKIVGLSPATPMMGYRFLMDPAEDEDWLTGTMVKAIDEVCRENRISGCSFLFVDPEWRERLEALGFTAWRHQSYVWENPGYSRFEDYLASFTKNQRRNIRRERAKMIDQAVAIRTFTGEAIPRSYFDRMYGFYAATNEKFGPWAAKYLNREFFQGLAEGFRRRLLLVAGFREHDEEPVGMSLLLVKNDRLLGRYWGASQWIDSLHFNLCYYSPIQWAIRHGVRRFDPGAGSTHKVRRGFRAVPNHSLHRFIDPRLNRVFQLNIEKINRMEQEQIDELNRGLPLKS